MCEVALLFFLKVSMVVTRSQLGGGAQPPVAAPFSGEDIPGPVRTRVRKSRLEGPVTMSAGETSRDSSLVEHSITLKDTAPVRRRMYWVPERLLSALKNKVGEMLAFGVIERGGAGVGLPGPEGDVVQ